MVIYDYECIVSSSSAYKGSDSLGIKHVPNQISYRLICNECLGEDCDTCGKIQSINFTNTDDVVGEFSTFLKNDPRLKNA
ncbi:unnamed protein product [Caenorhabditis sp. 36 PRJEB53466]|nr:unnamed protein product [Caenorhabditis sp. 36 PRJEB53466]